MLNDLVHASICRFSTGYNQDYESFDMFIKIQQGKKAGSQ